MSTAQLPAAGTPESVMGVPARHGRPPGLLPVRHRRRFRYFACTVLVAGATCVSVTVLNHRGHPALVAPAAAATDTVPVTRTDLVEREKVDGTLGYADAYTVPAPPTEPFADLAHAAAGTAQTSGAGIVTGLPEVGRIVRRGERVMAVNGRPITLWLGATPLWRELKAGVADGEDVRELEENLHALGFAPDLTADSHFTEATARAVRRWQKALKVPQTGRVGAGDVVVRPGELRITRIDAVLGAPATGTLLAATGIRRTVAVDLPAARARLARQGDRVQVVLPDGTKAAGRISGVGTVATVPGSSGAAGPAKPGEGTGKAAIAVQVSLDDPRAVGNLDAAPVTVLFVGTEHKGVLTVPVTALLATGEGSYGVEVVDGDGAAHVVEVELGLSTDGRVEVSGAGLREGMRVKAAST